MVWNEKRPEVSIAINRGMSEEQKNKYWHTHTADGYTLQGRFWKREWKLEESSGGGKC